jgi:hypothetical protein
MELTGVSRIFVTVYMARVWSIADIEMNIGHR